MHVDQSDRPASLDRARVPLVLPLVEVTIDSEGVAAVVVDDAPHESAAPIARGSLGRLLEEIAAELGPVRVHITETDGSEFTDVIVPDPAVACPASGARTSPVPGIAGKGFLPHEDVDVAVVIARQTADADGTAQLRIPPVLAGRTGIVALIGRTSGAFTFCEQT